MKNNTIKLVISIGLSYAASAIGSIFTAPAINSWYINLNKPSFNPPNWVFGPVWAILYFFIGISLYLFWTRRIDLNKTAGFLIFGFQLILNVLWSVIFFRYKSPEAAAGTIILLWLAIAATIIIFAKHSKPAGLVLLPYLAWVSFAAYLNFSIASLN